MVSKTAKYALRAVVFLAERQGAEGDWVPIDEVAGALDIPRNYLSKVLNTLKKAGVLHSARGPGGGFRLALEASRVTVGEVAGALDEWPGRRMPCLLSDGPCDPDQPCVTHETWCRIARQATEFFETTPVSGLSIRGDAERAGSSRK